MKRAVLGLLAALIAALVLVGADEDPYFRVESAAEREALPEFKTIPPAPTAELTPASGRPSARDYAVWGRSHGDGASSRYSALDQINRDNVDSLEVAWTYRSGDGAEGLQANPVIVDGVMYAPTAGGAMVAVDAATGEERWRREIGDLPAFRGLAYWPGDAERRPRVLFTSRKDLWALDARTGEPVAEFGEGGKTPGAGTVAPAVHENVLVVPMWNVVKGFDVRNGELLWQFHAIPRQGEYGYDTWDQPDDGANCWGGMALDEARGIAYFSTGSPHPNLLGARHRGRNLFANSVVALDAKTGKRLWHFQEIRHDIWDLDIPAPPNLVTVERDGKLYDAVAQVTKIGNTLLLDRVSGKPLFPFRLRRAPTSNLPGEATWPYQPFPELPEPFARQEFTLDDVTDLSEASRTAVLEQLEGVATGWFRPVELERPLVIYGVHGGAEWTGAAFDPTSRRLFVTANNLPWFLRIAESDGSATPDPKASTPGAKVYRERCAICHGDAMLGKGVAPELRNAGKRHREGALKQMIAQGVKTMPAIELSGREQSAVVDFLLGREAATRGGPKMADRPNYYFYAFKKLLDHEGRPGVKPPWGTLNAIDLDTGRIAWSVPLGEYPELTRRGVPKTGTENFGGATVTAGGLVFAAGTRDEKIRAFDAETGRELWEARLPFGGFAPPAVYEVDGREFVVIAATGGGKLGGRKGDAYVAFALPASRSTAAE